MQAKLLNTKEPLLTYLRKTAQHLRKLATTCFEYLRDAINKRFFFEPEKPKKTIVSWYRNQTFTREELLDVLIEHKKDGFIQNLWLQFCRFKIDDPDLPFHHVTRYDSTGKLMTVLNIPVGEGVILDYNFVDYGDYLNLNLLLDSYIWGFIYHRLRTSFWDFVEGDKQPTEFEYEDYWVVRRKL